MKLDLLLFLVVKTPMKKQLNCEADILFDHTLIFLSKAAVMLLCEVRCGHTAASQLVTHCITDVVLLGELRSECTKSSHLLQMRGQTARANSDRQLRHTLLYNP